MTLAARLAAYWPASDIQSVVRWRAAWRRSVPSALPCAHALDCRIADGNLWSSAKAVSRSHRLAASIKVSGALQNLIVVKGARGMHEVCASGRRLEALRVLAHADDILDNYPVPVLIVPADKALIAKLVEIVFHIPMGRAAGRCASR